MGRLSDLGGVDWMYTKTLQESTTTPESWSNVGGVKVAKQVINTVGRERLPDSPELEEEKRMIELEVRALLDKVLELGDGDQTIGELKAVEAGVLDSPFSPWKHVKGNVLPIRDDQGAVRWLDTGNLPFSNEIIEYHREKIKGREKHEKRKADLEMVMDDITSLCVSATREAAQV